MKRLVEFSLESGSTILIEADEPGAAGKTVRGLGSGEIEAASQTFEAALERVKPVAGGIIGILRGLPDSPDQAVVEFGLKLGVKAGALIASASTEDLVASGGDSMPAPDDAAVSCRPPCLKAGLS